MSTTSEAKNRRQFLASAAAMLGAAFLPFGASTAGAETAGPSVWLANHAETRLMSADGLPAAWLPRWTRMLLVQARAGGWLDVWVPRYDLEGRVQAAAVGPVGAPHPADLVAERQEGLPSLVAPIDLPGRVTGGANLRLWPAPDPDTLLRTLPHNGPLRILANVEGEDGEEWYRVNLLDGAAEQAIGTGYLHHSLVRLPRIQAPRGTAPGDRIGRWLEADLQEPAMITAFQDGAAIWASLTLKGRASSRTQIGEHTILRRVAREIMNSETLHPPVPRNAPGGYYLKDVLWTQYFLGDGSSIHYNYWSSNWGYAGSNGCLGLGYNEAKFAWEFAEIGTPVQIFA